MFRVKSLFQVFGKSGEPFDPALYCELVRALYNATSTPGALVGATLVALAVSVSVWIETADPVFAICSLTFGAIGIFRILNAWKYDNARPDLSDIGAAKLWERRALVGAWTFSALVGLIGAYTVFFHAGTNSEILTNSAVLGYIAGISSRNASRPLITLGQITATCVPFFLSLLLHFDLTHGILAGVIIILYLGTTVVSRNVFANVVSRHAAYKKIERLARKDSLTSLLNRSAFLSLLENELGRSVATGEPIAVLSIDLDGFKRTNDAFGHPAGDLVLKAVALEIGRLLADGDEAARIGGDEFLVMLQGRRAIEAEELVQCLLDRISNHLEIGQPAGAHSASIGLAVAPNDAKELDSLLRSADLALYEAKRSGRGRFVRYSPSMARQYESRLALEHDLSFALQNDQLSIEYQPIVDPRSGRSICCEALLRWHHPVFGKISPDVFIPVAESTGLIRVIGEWVLLTACAEAARWPSDIKIAVNLSPVQFRRGREIVEVVTQVLAKTGLSPSRLELEITESVLIEDSGAALAILEELRAEGVGISLDDFGVGFASLAYLNDFPFSQIKIDRKFTRNVCSSPRASAIIKGISQIARDLSIERIAEGVETEEQLQMMRHFGINAIQGYLFSRPLSAEAISEIIRRPIVPAKLDPAVEPHKRLAS
jgi:diguanylate cyclase (GGDEF)-like protein